jgi:hypothetical protein
VRDTDRTPAIEAEDVRNERTQGRMPRIETIIEELRAFLISHIPGGERTSTSDPDPEERLGDLAIAAPPQALGRSPGDRG